MTRLCATAVCFIALCSISAFGQTQTPQAAAPAAALTPGQLRHEYKQKTDHAYYKLSKHGFQGFHCTADPDWDELYRNVKTNAYMMQDLKPALKQTHFEITVGATGASSVTHQLGELPRSAEVADRLRSTADGMDDVVNGALQSWAGLAARILLPDADDDSYDVALSEGKYVLRHHETNSNLRLVVDSAGRLEQLEESNSRATITLHPHWDETAEGLILAGYEASLKVGDETVQKMRVGYVYVELHGMRLPQLITLWIDTPEGVLSGPIAFGKYKFPEKTAVSGDAK
ncbi:MAG: hypothetical protein P4M01_01120 [Acidobacteriota bacterium]|nr:hypothetical protein [Acidobacteriota bacterium]